MGGVAESLIIASSLAYSKEARCAFGVRQLAAALLCEVAPLQIRPLRVVVPVNEGMGKSTAVALFEERLNILYVIRQGMKHIKKKWQNLLASFEVKACEPQRDGGSATQLIYMCALHAALRTGDKKADSEIHLLKRPGYSSSHAWLFNNQCV